LALNIFDLARSQGIEPDLYNQIQPMVQQMVGEYGMGRNLTEADIDRMTNEIVASGIRRGLPQTVHDGRSLNDIVRFLILLNLVNNGYNTNLFWYLYFGGLPVFLLPPFGGGRPPIFRPVPPPRPPVRPTPPTGGGRPIPPPGRPQRPGSGR